MVTFSTEDASKRTGCEGKDDRGGKFWINCAIPWRYCKGIVGPRRCEGLRDEQEASRFIASFEIHGRQAVSQPCFGSSPVTSG